MSQDSSSLPEGIKKLDLGPAIITFLEDKAVIAPKGSEEHITLHYGTNSKILDIHRTRRTKGGHEKYTTLFTIPHDQLAPIAVAMANELLRTLRSLFRPLRIGWMARNHIGAEPGFFPGEEAFPFITKIEKKRIMLDESKVLDRLGKLEYLDDLYDLPNGQGFSLISFRHRRRPRIIGFGFKISDAHGRPRLIWCPNTLFNREMKSLRDRISSTLTTR